MNEQQMTVIPPRSPAMIGAPHELTIEELVAQSKKIQECMKLIMQKDEHYGVIPGTGGRDGKPAKPTLLKPGAEKLCLLFRLDPEYEVVREVHEPTRIAYTIRCVLFHIPTATRVASGLGACNSREEKYMRPAPKKCPACNKEAIIKGKEEYGGGWVCFKKKDGCGAKFPDGDESIEGQTAGIKEPDDLDNTLLKMACKRALVAAVLNATAASDFFTQDLEDLTEKAAEVAPQAPKDVAGPGPNPPPQSGSAAGPPMPTEISTQSRSTPATAAKAPGNASTTPNAAASFAGNRTVAANATKPPAVHYEKDPVVMAKATRLLQQLGWAKPHAVNWLKKHFQADSFAKLSADQAVTAVEKLEIEVEGALALEERRVAEQTKGQTP